MSTLIKSKSGVKLYEIQSPDPKKPEMTRYILTTPRTPEEFRFEILEEAESAFDLEVKRITG